MRRTVATITAVLLLTVSFVAMPTDATAATPCKGGKYRSDCVAIAKKAPRAGTTTRSGGGGSHYQASSSRGGKSGPSKLEILRRNQQEFLRRLARHDDANWSYKQCLNGGSTSCKRPVEPTNVLYPTGVVVTLIGQPRPAGAPPALTITPAQAGAIAVARLSLPANTPSIGPDPKKNKWKMAVIGYPLWLWAEGPTHIGPVGENVGGLSVSLDARVSKTMFLMGDGKSVTCSRRGTPYTSSVQPGAKSPTCGYVYEKPSLPSKEYTVTAITYWDVTWTVNGNSGVQTVPMAATEQLPVGEVQVLRR